MDSDDIGSSYDSMGQRIKARRKEFKLSQIELAKKCEVRSSSTVSQWESNDTAPTGRHLHLLARALDTTQDWLLNGSLQPWLREDREIQHLNHRVVRIPLLRHGDTDRPDVEEWIMTTIEVSTDAFAIEQRGLSMIKPNEPRSLPDRAIAIVEPNTTARSNDIVLASIGPSGDMVIRMYTKEGPLEYLMPFNSDFRVHEMTSEDSILGVVVAAQIEFRRN